jgi:hypothetical protein
MRPQRNERSEPEWGGPCWQTQVHFSMRLAFAQLMNVAAASTTIPVTNAAMQEYAEISLRTLAICIPGAASPICVGTFKATSAPWRKREILRIGAVKWS